MTSFAFVFRWRVQGLKDQGVFSPKKQPVGATGRVS